MKRSHDSFITEHSSFSLHKKEIQGKKSFSYSKATIGKTHINTKDNQRQDSSFSEIEKVQKREWIDRSDVQWKQRTLLNEFRLKKLIKIYIGIFTYHR